MESWQERVYEEKDDLDFKRDRLDAFLKSGAVVSEQARTLLEQQLAVMITYSEILRQRIALFR